MSQCIAEFVGYERERYLTVVGNDRGYQWNIQGTGSLCYVCPRLTEAQGYQVPGGVLRDTSVEGSETRTLTCGEISLLLCRGCNFLTRRS